tara:strand:+ start:186 stop:506 length:321 start_codon:yes stop_codon:yes gene_type:complete
MSRSYSDKFLLGLNNADEEKIGVKLAKICVAADFRIVWVADTFGVSKMCIHNWFKGRPVRDKNNTKIKNFIAFIEKGLKNGELPINNSEATKQYLESEIKPNLTRV